eukprot:NODE_221_length_1784_cov_410.751880.p1 GENE.NODE_221_length_1784_cov_410.751880~~NODE_221_length_1784_cov_410.751880.p1  ORF type:complete len:544 (-),score=141.32 NODE_221_length_1784_cov_410.751880:135-1766(-)
MGGLDPTSVFMHLVAYSRDASGAPGPDVEDGIMYVVTERSEYSLLSYLEDRASKMSPLSIAAVRRLVAACCTVVAALHAKGFTHLDLKPENLMFFDGRLKLIDVEGCLRHGHRLCIDDSSISFSPCYCAPEWAKFISDDDYIRVTPGLDVWSIGMTICEIVALVPILKTKYGQFLRQSRTEASNYFMEWLSHTRRAPIPMLVLRFDPQLADLLTEHICVCNPKHRKSLASCLLHPYLVNEDLQRKPLEEAAPSLRPVARRRSVYGSQKILMKGLLFKLDVNGDRANPEHWHNRDFWITDNGSLCYFSHRENKRMVLFDAHDMCQMRLERAEGEARPHAFTITIETEHSADTPPDVTRRYMACHSEEEYLQWTQELRRASRMETLQTLRLGGAMGELKSFRLNVKNRRAKVTDPACLLPVLKGKLWKLKTEGNPLKPEEWYLREMWLANNGSLAYWSVSAETELIYYTGADVARATVLKVAREESCFEWTFQVRLCAVDGIEFEPGEFAAESKDMLEAWIEEFAKFSVAPAPVTAACPGAQTAP